MRAKRRCIPIQVVPYGIQLVGLARHDDGGYGASDRDANRVCNVRARLERDSERLVNNEGWG